jgi:hypothetical protein
MHPEERRDAWIRRRAEWWATRRMAKCSEDIWDIREWVHVLICENHDLYALSEPLTSFPTPITNTQLAARPIE